MAKDCSEFTTEIFDLNASGQGIGRLDQLIVFIDGALIGEKVRAKVLIKKKNYATAKLLKVLNPSEDRTKPICPIFNECGGCQIMHLDYEASLKYKRDKVNSALTRIGKIDDVNLEPTLKADPLYYRNKIQLPFFESGGKLSLGLYKKHSNDVVQVERCYIHSKLGQKVFEKAKELLIQTNLKPFDSNRRLGFLRHLLIRSSERTGQSLVVLITQSKKHQKELQNFAKQLMRELPEVIGVLQNVNQKRYNSIMGDELVLLSGESYFYEEIQQIKMKISAHAFFQVNTNQAERLFTKAIELADLNENDILLDAYCGIGIYSLLTAKQVKKTIGIECIPQAIEDAKENARINGISNAEFIVGKVEDHIDMVKSASAVIINPPRKGVETPVLEAIAKTKVNKLVYVSCDPATLARDLKYLIENGYKLDVAIPVDLFPQTTHVETIARLTFS